MNEKEDKLSYKMFSNDNFPKSPKTKNNKMILLIIIFFIGITFLIIAIILMLIFGNNNNNQNNQNKDNNNEEYNPIPKNEDLEFNEEEHRKFSREVATQTMVLATNNGLPIENTDQVVLFGSGTNNTIYGGDKIYKKGISDNIIPIMVLEGIENKIKENANKCIYIKNEIGYEIGKSGINKNETLTENDIKLFSIKNNNAKRTVAIMTISRLPVELNDIPQDKSIYGTHYLIQK